MAAYGCVGGWSLARYGSFVYSALIYLNDHGSMLSVSVSLSLLSATLSNHFLALQQGTDFEGGEFNFIDSPEGGGGDEERKVQVQPRRGRMLTFTY